MAGKTGSFFACVDCSKLEEDNCKVSLDCEHEICIKCLLRSVINFGFQTSNTDIQCPVLGCNVEIRPEVFQPFLEPQLYAQLAGVLESKKKCPKCKASAEIDRDCFLGNCAACDYSFCSNCREDFHGFECEMQREEDGNLEALNAMLQRLLDARDDFETLLEGLALEDSEDEEPVQETQPIVTKPQFDCSICLMEVDLDQSADFGCEHTTSCVPCTKQFFESCIQDGRIYDLKCPEVGCGKEASQDLIKSIVDTPNYIRLEELYLNDALKHFPEVVNCPNVNCQQRVVSQPEYGYCDLCDFRFCTECNLAFHGSAPCGLSSKQLSERQAQYIKATEEERQRLEEEERRRKAEQDSASEKLITAKFKKCPTCPTLSIEKTEGCNKRKCTQCNTIFCYLCGNKITDRDPYKHFQSTACQLFEVPPEKD